MDQHGHDSMRMWNVDERGERYHILYYCTTIINNNIIFLFAVQKPFGIIGILEVWVFEVSFRNGSKANWIFENHY